MQELTSLKKCSVGSWPPFNSALASAQPEPLLEAGSTWCTKMQPELLY